MPANYPYLRPNSLWLVEYECRYDVVRVSPQCDGFFAPGQEPCWGLDQADWIAEISPETQQLIPASYLGCD